MEKTAGNDNKWDIIINDLHILASLLYKKCQPLAKMSQNN